MTFIGGNSCFLNILLQKLAKRLNLVEKKGGIR